MLKSSLRKALADTLPDDDLPDNIRELLPLSDTVEDYEDELRSDLSATFSNSVYVTGTAAVKKPETNAVPIAAPWEAIIMTEIHKQLNQAFIEAAKVFGVDVDLVGFHTAPDDYAENDGGGILTISPDAQTRLPSQSDMQAARIYELVETMQSWVDENGDEEDGTFEVKPGKGQEYLVIRYDYDVLYNALNAMVPEIEGRRIAPEEQIQTIEKSLNSALHAMERFDAPTYGIN